jgi:hypothetical protein
VVHRSFELSAVVDVPPEQAVDVLVDLSAHLGLHPLLVSATVLGAGRSAEGDWVRWALEDRLGAGPLRVPFRYEALLTRTSPTSFTSDVRPAPGSRLRGSTTAADHPSGTLLIERTEVTGPRPLVGYTTRQARVAHERTYGLLPGLLSGRRPPDDRRGPRRGG